MEETQEESLTSADTMPLRLGFWQCAFKQTHEVILIDYIFMGYGDICGLGQA